MSASPWRRPSKPAVFIGLMLASGLLLLTPRDPLLPLKNLAQPLALPQFGYGSATNLIAETARDITRDTVSSERYREVVQRSRAFEMENASLREKLTQLESDAAELAGLRELPGMPKQAKLIPARVLGYDAAPGRDTLSVSPGRLNDVEPEDWVASGLTIDVGTREGVVADAAVLSRECLVGWVAETAPLVSRVVLLVDRVATHPVGVRITPRSTQRPPATLDGEPITFVLQGLGGGLMAMRDIPASLVDETQIQIGDLVTSDPNDPRLPVAMMIGQIERLERARDAEKPLYYDAIVRPVCDDRELRDLVIIDLSSTATWRGQGG